MPGSDAVVGAAAEEEEEDILVWVGEAEEVAEAVEVDLEGCMLARAAAAAAAEAGLAACTWVAVAVGTLEAEPSARRVSAEEAWVATMSLEEASMSAVTASAPMYLDKTGSLRIARP